MVSSKKCFKCNEVKSISEFYVHTAMGDGHLGKCKECTKADANTHRLKNIDRIREYDKRRSKLPERTALALKVNQAWRTEDRRRAKCHNAVIRAIKSGTLERMPCSVCGSTKSLAHHEDYDKPLDVIWYCQPHHKARHKEMRATK